MGAEKVEAGRSVRRLGDDPDMMGAHTESEAAEAEDSRVESRDQGAVPQCGAQQAQQQSVLFLFLHS